MDDLPEQQRVDLHAKLLQQKEQLETLLVSNKETSEPVQLDQQALGRVSRIDAIQQQKMAAANRIAQEQTLRRTLIALKKAEDGSYGYCDECDDLIRYERLAIKPETPLCIGCQSKAEAR